MKILSENLPDSVDTSTQRVFNEYMTKTTAPITSMDDLTVGSYYRTSAGRMDWKLTEIKASQTGYRFATIERFDNVGRHHLRVISERKLAASGLRPNA